MSQFKIGRYVAPKNEPQAYALVASITRDGKAMLRFLDDKEHRLRSYDLDNLVLLPRGVALPRMSRAKIVTSDEKSTHLKGVPCE